MKKLPLLFLAFFSCSALSAVVTKDYDFEQERMLIAEDGIYLVSSFDSKDRLTAYSHYGEFLWESSFFAKITSWQVVGNRIFVFSKDRDGYSTYLTCVDRYTGRMLWQRP